MILLIALVIFVAIAAATWFIGLGLYQGWLGEPDLTKSPNFRSVSVISIGAVSLAGFVPFPMGYLSSLVVWAWATCTIFPAPSFRIPALFIILAVLSLVSRLVILGVLALRCERERPRPIPPNCPNLTPDSPASILPK